MSEKFLKVSLVIMYDKYILQNSKIFPRDVFFDYEYVLGVSFREKGVPQFSCLQKSLCTQESLKPRYASLYQQYINVFFVIVVFLRLSQRQISAQFVPAPLSGHRFRISPFFAVLTSAALKNLLISALVCVNFCKRTTMVAAD